MTTKQTKAKASFWRDKEKNIVLWQSPNVLIIMWAMLALVAHVSKQSHFKNVMGDTATMFVFAWACLELATGVNYFRRVLGFIILAMIILPRF